MRILRIAALTAFVFVALVAGLAAQAVPASTSAGYGARLLLDYEIGCDGGLGFKCPHIGVGASGEVPLLADRLELLPAFTFSPDHKTFSDTGHSIGATAAAAVWFTHRAGAYGGVKWSAYWSTQPHGQVCTVEVSDSFSIPNSKLQVASCSPVYTTPLYKSGVIPFVGAVIRDGWFASPGRLYVSYLFPTGCVWAAQCTLPADGVQSNRIQGIRGDQEFRLYRLTEHSAMRFGIVAEWVNFCDQSNPQVITKRICHNTGAISMTVRLELGHPEGY